MEVTGESKREVMAKIKGKVCALAGPRKKMDRSGIPPAGLSEDYRNLMIARKKGDNGNQPACS
jgi:hypothetical protein